MNVKEFMETPKNSNEIEKEEDATNVIKLSTIDNW